MESIHISLPINKLLDAGIAPQDVPLPHEFLFNQELMGQLYPSFKKGLLPFFTFNWGEYSDLGAGLSVYLKLNMLEKF